MNPAFKDSARKEYNELLNKGENLEKSIVEYISPFPLPNKPKDIFEFASKYNGWIHRIELCSLWLNLSRSELYFLSRPFSVFQYSIKNHEELYLQDLLRAVQERMVILVNTSLKKSKGPFYRELVIIGNEGITFGSHKIKLGGKRLELVHMLKKSKHIRASEIRKVLKQDNDVISASKRIINERFRKMTDLPHDLIIHPSNGGYAFNNTYFLVH